MKGFGIFFLIYLFLEVFTTIEVGSYLGGVGTFFEIVGSAIVGIFILVNFKYSIAESFQKVSRMEIDPKDVVSSSIFSLIGAILLIIPGILSDFIGILMQFKLFSVNFSKLIAKNYTVQKKYNYKKNKEDIIDVEIIESKSSN